MWKEGSIRVNGEVFHYWMKQYDKGSEWGIDGGCISKLMLKRARSARRGSAPECASPKRAPEAEARNQTLCFLL